MAYIDGFVLAVPEKNMAAYRKLARTAARVWREHGALAYVEALADDVPVGKLTSFPRAVKLKPGETVVFSWIVYKSRKDRDRVNKAVFADKRMSKAATPMPFDGKRMIFGGFKTFIEA